MSSSFQLRTPTMYHPHTKVEDYSFDILNQLDTEFDRDSSQEYLGDCPSLSSSFFSSDVSTMDAHDHRRPSLASTMDSPSPEARWPSSATFMQTPMMIEPGTHLSYRQYVRPTAYLSSSHSILHLLQKEERDPDSTLWEAHDDSCLPMLDTTQDIGVAGLYRLDMSGLGHGNADPSLTKAIFATDHSHALTASDADMLEWNNTIVQPPADTIEPSLAFQATVPSSPVYKHEPSTPLKGHLSSSAFFSSSPSSTISPWVVPSQHELDDFSYDSLHQAFGETKKQRVNDDRLHRRAYEKKRRAGSSSKLKDSPAKTGMDCDFIIEGNGFPCSYADCVDKHTNKPKRFKTPGAKKRHEKTVHEKHQHLKYTCWVPECGRVFSRTDNLKSHLRNTHSKKTRCPGKSIRRHFDRNCEV